MNDVIEISPQEEAERLWRGAEESFAGAEGSLARLSEALDLGVRAVEIAAGLRLQGVRGQLPGSVAALLETPDPEVRPARDAISVPKSLGFLDLIDMSSADGLECVSRKLHHGWEDRASACQRARELARRTLGLELDAERRDHLLLLEAYRNRIFRMPPPVRIVAPEIVAAFPTLAWFYEHVTAPAAAPP